jgi:hypothetical protein
VGQADLLENAIPKLQIAWGADVARMRNVNVHDLLDRGRPGAHYHYAIRNLDRFVNIVRDKDDGLALRLPDAK